MLSTSAFAETAALVGDPARANMLAALMDGRALTATELAGTAGIAPQTASGHLARLTAAGLLAMERQGRHRYTGSLRRPSPTCWRASCRFRRRAVTRRGGGRRPRSARVTRRCAVLEPATITWPANSPSSWPTG